MDDIPPTMSLFSDPALDNDRGGRRLIRESKTAIEDFTKSYEKAINSQDTKSMSHSNKCRERVVESIESLRVAANTFPDKYKDKVSFLIDHSRELLSQKHIFVTHTREPTLAEKFLATKNPQPTQTQSVLMLNENSNKVPHSSRSQGRPPSGTSFHVSEYRAGGHTPACINSSKHPAGGQTPAGTADPHLTGGSAPERSVNHPTGPEKGTATPVTTIDLTQNTSAPAPHVSTSTSASNAPAPAPINISASARNTTASAPDVTSALNPKASAPAPDISPQVNKANSTASKRSRLSLGENASITSSLRRDLVKLEGDAKRKYLEKKHEMERKQAEMEKKQEELMRNQELEKQEMKRQMEKDLLDAQVERNETLARIEEQKKGQIGSQADIEDVNSRVSNWLETSVRHAHVPPPVLPKLTQNLPLETQTKNTNVSGPTLNHQASPFQPRHTSQPSPPLPQPTCTVEDGPTETSEDYFNRRIGLRETDLEKNDTSSENVQKDILILQREQKAQDTIASRRPPKDKRFSGDDLRADFESYLNNFEKCLDVTGVTPLIKFLECQHWFVGTASLVVATYQNVKDPVEAWNFTIGHLKREFGRKKLTAKQLLDSLLAGPALNVNDIVVVRNFIVKLGQTHRRAQETKRDTTFNTNEIYDEILKKKFPAWKTRWHVEQSKHEERFGNDDGTMSKELTFEDFLTYLRRQNSIGEKKVISDPIVATSIKRANTKPGDKPPQHKVAAINVESVTPKATPQQNFAKSKNFKKGNKNTKDSHEKVEKPKTYSHAISQPAKATSSAAPSTSTSTCPSCESPSPHKLEDCRKFCGKNIEDKYTFVMSKGFCFLCLNRGHMAPQCTIEIKCGECDKKHHSLLHRPKGFSPFTTKAKTVDE